MTMMPDKCPRCGANRTGIGSNGVLYACFSGHLDGNDVEGMPCLRRQVAALRKRIESARRVIESARKVAAGGRVYVSELRERLAEYDREVSDDA